MSRSFDLPLSDALRAIAERTGQTMDEAKHQHRSGDFSLPSAMGWDGKRWVLREDLDRVLSMLPMGKAAK